MYAGKRVLVTGGLGFLGSTLALRLVELGARVTIVDSSVSGCGANPFNMESVRKEVALIVRDIADAQEFSDVIRASDVVFNLAGEISHTESMRDPLRDLEINTAAQLRFLLVCSSVRPGVRIVYAGTRQVYGRPEHLPADENEPARPIDFNGVHKLAATQYHLMMTRLGELDAVVLRLTNVYGPRMALDLPQQGFLGAFLRAAILGEPLVVYGGGEQLRDPVYVDDAIEAFLIAGAAADLPSRVYNIGGPEALSVCAIAEIMSRSTGSPVFYPPFPECRRRIDIGSYVADASRIRRELGWAARTPFDEGIRRALDYYHANRDRYLTPSQIHAAARVLRPPIACPQPSHEPT